MRSSRETSDGVCGDRLRVAAIGGLLVASIAASSVSAKFSVGIAHSLNATCIALLTWAAMRAPDTPIGRMLHNRTVVVIGTASYSLYLWQQLFLNPGNEGVLCRFPLNLVLAFVAAFASFYLVERPFLILKGAVSKLEGGSSMSVPDLS